MEYIFGFFVILVLFIGILYLMLAIQIRSYKEDILAKINGIEHQSRLAIEEHLKEYYDRLVKEGLAIEVKDNETLN